VSDRERNRETPAEVLGRLYGLTPAEVRLAEAIVGGDRPAEAAKRFGVTLGTVRNQLKAVFAKTGARNQADLVRLALTGPAGSAPPGDET
jgi:DNA-binding CsgD family transcriptional regulator